MRIAETAKDWLYRRLAVRDNVSVGERFHVGPGSRIWAPESLTIGSDVYVGKWCTIEVDGSIGDGTLIANSVGIVGRRDHDAYWTGGPVSRAPWVGEEASLRTRNAVKIGRNVWIGYGAVILSGVTIGDHVIVGAGARVSESVETNTVVVAATATAAKKRYSQQELARVEAALDGSYGPVA